MGILRSLASILRDEGIWGLMSGLGVRLCVLIPGGVMYLSSYEICKHYYSKFM